MTLFVGQPVDNCQFGVGVSPANNHQFGIGVSPTNNSVFIVSGGTLSPHLMDR